MGVQGRGNQSEVDELREQLRDMQTQLDHLERATQARNEDYCSEDDYGAARNAGSSERQGRAANRRNRRRRPPSESDDSEEVPEYGLHLLSCIGLSRRVLTVVFTVMLSRERSVHRQNRLVLALLLCQSPSWD